MLYRATRDGDSAKTFHNLCDMTGKTLTLILTQDNWKFGGFTDMGWQSFTNPGALIIKSSPKIFIFSLNKKKKYLSQQKEGSIFSQGILGPSFGTKDFSLKDNCFSEKSFCNFPSSFGNEKDGKNEFNGGKQDFIMKEVEVYLVKVTKTSNKN